MNIKGNICTLIEKADERQTKLIYSYVEALIGKEENVVETTDRICDVFADISVKAWKARGLINVATEWNIADRGMDCYDALIHSILDYVFDIEQVASESEKKSLCLLSNLRKSK